MPAPLFTRSALFLAAALAVAGCASSTSGGSSGAGAGGGSSAPAASGSAAGSSATPAAAQVTVSLAGGHLVGPGNRTLYYNTVDTATSIMCTGGCASTWPPVLGTPAAGTGVDASMLGTTPRRGGGSQVTFNGHPLYEFAADGASTTDGSGLSDGGGTWVVAKPLPASAPASTLPAASSPATSSTTGANY